MQLKLEDKEWWEYLEEDLQELLKQSALLLKRVEDWKEDFHDYAFCVFPAAKAYEGFLKKIFLDLRFISEKEYFGKRFRVGKALNPDLDKHLRKKFSVYDRLLEHCQREELADRLWLTWKTCRNVLFHWFPEEKNAITLPEAKERVSMVIESMDQVFSECSLNQ